MGDDEPALLRHGIDVGFTEHIAKLVGIAITDWGDASFERFCRGLANARLARAKMMEFIDE